MVVRVPQKVYDGLKAVKQSSLTNMLNVYEVQRLCADWDYWDTVVWIEENRDEYVKMIFEGVEVG